MNDFKTGDGIENYPSYTKLLLYNPLVIFFNMIPRKNTSLSTRGSADIPLLSTKHRFFQNSYFPAAIKEWNRLDIDIWNSDSISISIVKNVS